MIKIVLTVILCLISATIACAGGACDQQGAAAFTDNALKPALENVMATHKQKNLAAGEKQKIYDEIISPFFDHSITARLTLGKQQWETLTTDQQARFIHLFGKRLQNFYLQRMLLLYPDTEILFKDTLQEKNKAVVNTELKSSRLKTNRKVQYKIAHDDRGWKIYDIDINGVSILKNFQAQFKHFLGKHTVQDLLQELERPE